MSKHTPGPWTTKESRNQDIFIIGAGDLEVAAVSSEEIGGPMTETEKADASLIAAAPDLLDVLKMVATLDRAPTAGEKRQIASAIAKAEGKS